MYVYGQLFQFDVVKVMRKKSYIEFLRGITKKLRGRPSFSF